MKMPSDEAVRTVLSSHFDVNGAKRRLTSVDHRVMTTLELQENRIPYFLAFILCTYARAQN